MCMFSFGDFLNLFFFLLGVGGVCGLLLNGIFFGGGGGRGGRGGGGHVWSTLRLRLRLGIVFGWGILKFKCFLGHV